MVVYPFLRLATVKAVARKRGPRTPQTDEQLLVYIKAITAASPFTGEGPAYKAAAGNLPAALPL